jgi:protein-disulfide isomerase
MVSVLPTSGEIMNDVQNDGKITIRKNTIYGIAIAGFAILIVLYVLSPGFGNSAAVDSPQAGQPTAVEQSTTAVPSNTQNSGSNGIVYLMDDDMTKGSDSAPLVLVEFSDFECPFCGRFSSQTLPSIVTEYVDTGKLQIVYRDFPLSFHPTAQKAAEATECADDQGKGWEMHDLIYANQGQMGSTQASAVSTFKSWAIDLNLDSTTFDSCLDSGKYESEVLSDASDGVAIGVRGTPAFRLGRRDGSQIVEISGAQPYEVFQANIEQLLQ